MKSFTFSFFLLSQMYSTTGHANRLHHKPVTSLGKSQLMLQQFSLAPAMVPGALASIASTETTFTQASLPQSQEMHQLGTGLANPTHSMHKKRGNIHAQTGLLKRSLGQEHSERYQNDAHSACDRAQSRDLTSKGPLLLPRSKQSKSNRSPPLSDVEIPWICMHYGCNAIFRHEPDLYRHEREKHPNPRPSHAQKRAQFQFQAPGQRSRQRSPPRNRRVCPPNVASFKCNAPGCDKAFEYQSNLDIHKELSHPKCNVPGCGGTFNTLFELKFHQKTAHGSP